MTDKRIQLSEFHNHYPEGLDAAGVKRLDCETERFGYGVRDGPYTTTFYASLVEEHYILREQRDGYGEIDYDRILGVSHTVEEADKRLYERAKWDAGVTAKSEHVETLEDLTRHCLPREGNEMARGK